MDGEARKLHLIEEILKIQNEALLGEVESVLAKNKLTVVERRSFRDFAGMMSDNEVDELEKIINEGCEQINSDDWK